jgi:hypothetical protein
VTDDHLVLAPLPDDLFSPSWPFYKVTSRIVRIFDEIRSALDNGDDAEEYAEFSWFAREYPRCYRHHISAAEYRLRNIYARYERAHKRLLEDVRRCPKDDFISTAYETNETHEIYWEFEAFLSSIGSALDLLARIVGTAYKEHLPPSFNKLCKKTHLTGPARRLRTAQRKWVIRMKSYRDCFVHYTPADTVLMAGAYYRRGALQVWCSIPRNPQARDIIRFRSSKRTDVLRYACDVWRQMLALDRVIAVDIIRMYRKNAFPQKRDNLFHVGRPVDASPSKDNS